jgi:tetratricopeptide (TPR) repeat protein
MGDSESAEAALRRGIVADRESAQAHSQLADLLGVAGREQELIDVLCAWADVEYDEIEKKERLRTAARLAESALRDVARAVRLYRAVLDVDGSDTGALDELIRLRMAEGAWSDVATLLEKRIDIETDPDTRVELRRKLAHALAGPLALPERAMEAWRAVLDEQPTDLDAMGQLERLYETAEQWSDLEELFQRRLDVAETPSDRIAVRVRLARLSETRFGRRSEAIEQLHEILGEDPQNREALDELERLYVADDRLDDLIALLERRANEGDIAQGLTVRIRLADAHEKKGDSEAALAAYAKVLEQDADHQPALRASARLHLAAGRAADAALVLERLIAILPLSEAREEAFRLAELAVATLNEPERAERVLSRIHELDPNDGEVRAKLKSHYDRHERWAELAQMLAIDAEKASETPEKLAILRRIADLYSSRLADPAIAATYLERAVALDPENRDVLLPLCDLYIAAGRQNDAIPVLEKIIASYGTRRSKEVAVFQHRLGRALEGMGNTSGALQAYDAAFKVDLTNVQILRDLGRLCYGAGDYERAQKTFRALLLQKLDANSGISKGDVYFYLGDISVKQGDPKKAISMLERALAEESGHAKATELLASLKS